MATVNDIAQVLATGLGLRTGKVMQHVRAAMEDGFLPEVGEADSAATVATLLTVAISQLSESPDQTPDLARQFAAQFPDCRRTIRGESYWVSTEA